MTPHAAGAGGHEVDGSDVASGERVSAAGREPDSDIDPDDLDVGDSDDDLDASDLEVPSTPATRSADAD